MKIFHQLRQINNPNKLRKMVKNTKRIPSIHTQAKNPNRIQKKTKAEAFKKLKLSKQKTTNAQNIASFSKTNTNRKPFRMLNHHYRMRIALIKTKLRTKLSSSNQQQPTAIRRQRNRNRRKSQKEEMKNKNRNSPHNNWSLHNHPPREIRNIIPELPTQNVPALPQNSSPLARQHRSHSCNKKNPGHKYKHKHRIKNK
jgi:hypothetical protein